MDKTNKWGLSALATIIFIFILSISIDWLLDNHEKARNIGLVLAAIIGLPFLIWRAIAIDRTSKAQLKRAEVDSKRAQTDSERAKLDSDRHLAQTYTTAIDQIGATHSDGSPQIEIRLGGFYTLEKIAQDNEDYHSQIMEVLCTYIRKNSPRPQNNEEEEIPVTLDTQTILIIIGRRNQKFDIRPLDLSDTNLLNADLQDANLENANLYHANLHHAYLKNANLIRANLQDANLHHAYLKNANLIRANLQDANLQGANLQGTKLLYTTLVGARLYCANLQSARLYRARLQGTDLKSANLRNADLENANLENANLENASLENASLQYADLQNADLEGVKNLKCDQLIQTKNWETTFRDESLACGKPIPSPPDS